MPEFLIAIFVGIVVLIGPIFLCILSIVAYARSRRISELVERMEKLERAVAQLSHHPPGAVTNAEQTQREGVLSAVEQADSKIVSELAISSEPPLIADFAYETPKSRASGNSPVGWETFVGQRAFGWIAVVLFVFSAVFFLRHAFQNNWIGPLGRVAISQLIGAGLVIAGWRHVRIGWHRFAGMLTAAGIIVLYLATYGAYGFYQLLPQQRAGIFLAIVVIESMIIAVLFRSQIVALVAVLGGLATPILMASNVDNYQWFFLYLLVLNVGALIALSFRKWSAIYAVTWIGTQLLFWSWYHSNYHPEKFAWTMGFSGGLFATHLTFAIFQRPGLPDRIQWERLAVFVSTSILSFVAFRALTVQDYPQWQGVLAMTLAVIYAASAKGAIALGGGNSKLPLTALAISIGFVAWVIPIQADVRWVALGWAVMALSLWLFGQRISSDPLKVLAGGMTVLSVGRVLAFDLPLYVREPFVPVFNGFAIPSLGVAICVLAGVVVAEHWWKERIAIERWWIAICGFAGMVLLWLVLSFDCYDYFVSQSLFEGDIDTWRWRGQLALTVLWTAFAVVQLAIGFSLSRERVRWMAMFLFVVTVIKVFVVDMANVQQLYRIAAFFVLAVVLGLVARTYQRFHTKLPA